MRTLGKSPLEFGEWPAGCKSSFLEGYASIRKVPDYKRMMPLLHLSRAVAAVGFTVKRGTWESRNSKLYQFNLRYLESLAGGEKVGYSHKRILRSKTCSANR